MSRHYIDCNPLIAQPSDAGWTDRPMRICYALMPPTSPSSQPPEDLLPVTDDLLLSEEQVQQIMDAHQMDGPLGEARLQTGNLGDAVLTPPPPPPRIVKQSPAPVVRKIVRRVAAAPGPQSSAVPLIAAAAVLILGGAGVAWWLLQKKPNFSAATPIKVDEVVKSIPAVSAAAATPASGEKPTIATNSPPTMAKAIAKSSPPAVHTKAVLAADRFDYDPGIALKGKEGGIGWNGPWTAPETTIAGSSLIGGLPGAAGSGGHAVLNAAAQVAISRPFAAPPWDAATGGEWWTSLLISLSGGDAAEDCELWINLQSAAKIDAVIRLTLTQKGSSFRLTGTGAAKPFGIEWEAGAPIHFVARTRATPAVVGSFDWQTELWLNPIPEDLLKGKGKPELILEAKGAAAPSFFGVCIQKPARKSSASIRIDEILLGKSPAAVVP